MHRRAVIFDLYGTLVHTPTRVAEDAYSREQARLLGVPHEVFRRHYNAAHEDRQRGRHGSARKYLASLCESLGVVPEALLLDRIEQYRMETIAGWLRPRPDALDVLRELGKRGFKLGLVSDCSWETSRNWAGLPFGQFIKTPVFSCEVGLKKPQPEIYRVACARLGVQPEQCVFVGDGGSNELTGAQSVGLLPVWVNDPGEVATAAYRPGAQTWDGEAVQTLSELLDMAELMAPP